MLQVIRDDLVEIEDVAHHQIYQAEKLHIHALASPNKHITREHALCVCSVWNCQPELLQSASHLKLKMPQGQ